MEINGKLWQAHTKTVKLQSEITHCRIQFTTQASPDKGMQIVSRVFTVGCTLQKQTNNDHGKALHITQSDDVNPTAAS